MVNEQVLNPVVVRKSCEGVKWIQPKEKKWEQYSRARIEQFLHYWQESLVLGDSARVLNVGSGGETFGVRGVHTHLGVSGAHLEGVQRAVISRLEDIPLPNGYFDLCICVSPAINRSNHAESVLSEFSRTLRAGGHLILDYDQSRSFEFLGTGTFARDKSYPGQQDEDTSEARWVYSKAYMDALLRGCGFSIIYEEGYHCVSALMNRIIGNQQKAAAFAGMDRVVQRIPGLRTISRNIILIARKM